MRRRGERLSKAALAVCTVLLWAALFYILWTRIPWAGVRAAILAVCGGILAVTLLWFWYQRRQVTRFADDLCRTLDRLMSGGQIENYRPYEDSLLSRVQGKFLQYFDIMNEGKVQSKRDKETIQGLVSDISHQVKTPVAGIKMYAGILRGHNLSEEQREKFLTVMEEQIEKLDFLLQALVKMSRLETGTFTLHPSDGQMSDTVARAMSTVWAQAEQKDIGLDADCDPFVTAVHDSKWTAEALGNILDNAVKYTPRGGSVTVTVRPWQFYVRIDVSDTGIGIAEEHYSDVFKRFYRSPETAGEEGIGLGLYLANGIITRQKGYISVKSKPGKGTTFSIYLPAGQGNNQKSNAER